MNNLTKQPQPIIRIRDLHKTYQKRAMFQKESQSQKVLDDINLDIHAPEIFGLIGQSGSGKSTLAKVLVKLTGIDSGMIEMFGEEISSMNERRFKPLRKQVQMIFQNPDSALNPAMTVSEILDEAIGLYDKDADNLEHRKHELLDFVSLSTRALQQKSVSLSGGEKRRVGIARALAVQPSLIIADEPTTGLDASIHDGILRLFQRLRDEHRVSILFITHDIRSVQKICDRVGVIFNGSIMEIGQADDVLQAPMHPYTHHLLSFFSDDIKLNMQDTSATIEEMPVSDGCRYAHRCSIYAEEKAPECVSAIDKPKLQEYQPGHMVRCHFAKS
jgi:oligopeptide/dipeptide ABC transporter ATP-binding protein